MKKKDIIMIGVAALLASSGLVWRLAKKNGTDARAKVEARTALITITLEGAVWYPGDYEVPEGTKLSEVIALAGGARESADCSSLALSQKLYKDVSLTIPTSSKISINKSDAKMLTQLPKVGPTLAARIVAYRKKIGGYSSLSELLSVEGMSEAIYAGIKDQIVL